MDRNARIDYISSTHPWMWWNGRKKQWMRNENGDFNANFFPQDLIYDRTTFYIGPHEWGQHLSEFKSLNKWKFRQLHRLDVYIVWARTWWMGCCCYYSKTNNNSKQKQSINWIFCQIVSIHPIWLYFRSSSVGRLFALFSSSFTKLIFRNLSQQTGNCGVGEGARVGEKSISICQWK